MEGHKLHNSMDTLDYVGDSQVSHGADTKSESNISSTCCTSSSSTNTLSLLNHLRVPTLSTLVRKWKKIITRVWGRITQ